MSWLWLGMLLGLTVSVPPGAMTVLVLLRSRCRLTSGLLLAALGAGIDGVYALLAATGVLAAVLTGGEDVLAVLSVLFLAGCAALLWPREDCTTCTGTWMVLCNPPQALLWLALAGSLPGHPPGLTAVMLFACGAAAATGMWFCTVSLAAHRFGGRLSDRLVRRGRLIVCSALLAGAVWQGVMLLFG